MNATPNNSIDTLKELMMKYDEYLAKYRIVYFFGVIGLSKFRKVGNELLEIEKQLGNEVDDESLRTAALELEKFMASAFKCLFPVFFMSKHAKSLREFLLKVPSLFPELAGLQDKAAKTTQYNATYYVKALKAELLQIS